MSQHLALASILAAADLPTKVVDMPEWGGTVLVRGLSKGAYDDLQKRITEQVQAAGLAEDEGADALRADLTEAEMVAACLAEPKVTPDEARQLRYKSIAAYKRLNEAIGEVNRIESAKATKSVAGGESGDGVPAAPGAGSGEDAGGASGGAAG